MPFPDFQEIVQWLGPQLASGTNSAFNAGTTNLIPPQVQTSYKNLLFRIQTISTANGMLQFTFYDSTTTLNVIATRTVFVRAGQPATIIVPQLGPAFAVGIQGSGAGGAVTWQAYPTNLEPGVTPQLPTNPLVYQWPVNIPGGGTQIFQLPPYAGGVQLVVITGASAGTLSVTAESLAFAASNEWYAVPLPANSTIFNSFYIGPMFNLLGIFNSAGVADNFFVALNIAPRSREIY